MISLVLVLIGIFKRDFSGFALIGFSFFFILGLVLEAGALQVEQGANSTNTFLYSASGDINSSVHSIRYDYQSWSDKTSHSVGFWTSVGSAVGFILMLFSINKSRGEYEN